MNCPNCNRPIASENNFCSHCGHQLKQDAGSLTAAAHHTIFSNPYTAPQRSNTDLGYMIVALLILLNVVIWIGWGFIGNRITDNNRSLYYIVRIITMGLAVGEFIVMFIFAKRAAYRIVIGIIGLIVTLYNLFFLIKTFNDLRGL